MWKSKIKLLDPDPEKYRPNVPCMASYTRRAYLCDPQGVLEDLKLKLIKELHENT